MKYFTIIVLIILAILIITKLIVSIIKNNLKTFVEQHSLFLKEIEKLNNEYKFYSLKKYDQRHIYDNANFYEDISCEDYLIYQLQFIAGDVIKQFDYSNFNFNHYKEYLSKIKQLPKGEYDTQVNGLKKQYADKYESKLADKLIKEPATNYYIGVKLYLSKINGNIYDSKSDYFKEHEVLSLIKRIRNKRGTFYNDKEIWNSICRVERGKVSNKMRFAVYKRDNYRCKYCGRSDIFANLEIDHIIPISKGGKSTMDNLQTLCHECNVRKGNRYL